jgi:hypothetical protein
VNAPSFGCDFGEDIRAGKSLREQSIEQDVQLVIAEAIRLTRRHLV